MPAQQNTPPAGGQDPHMIALSGLVYGIIYQNTANGYSVIEIDTGDDVYTATGICPSVAEGEQITVYGSWMHHPEYGRQFKFDNYEKHLPATETAILKYLCSGAVKGVGPVTAAKIVDAFGTDTFEVMEKHPDWLSSVQGISKAKAEKISEEFRAVAGIRTVMMFFREYVGAAVSVRIYNRWGAKAVDMVKSDPYILCEHIRGVGFEKADEIAASIGADRDSFERIRAGVIYLLNYNAHQNGHTCMPYIKLTGAAAELLGISMPDAEEAAKRMTASGDIVMRYTGGGRETGTLVCALPRYAESEKYIAHKLCAIDRTAHQNTLGDCERLIRMIELEEDITYEGLQRKAIYQALSSGVFILSGGPGTGKTTVIRALIGIFDSMGMRIALCAPTGRAAKRMSEATGREAATVHRLLEMDFSAEDEPRFIRGEDNLLEQEVIIIDEASMLDVSIAESLLRAVKLGARIIFIGDSSQLPSVGAGNFLADIIASERFPCVYLTKIFRQAEQSQIVTNAHAINEGRYPDISRVDGDFFFLRRERDEDIAATVAELCAVRLPRKYGEQARSGLQLITPSRRGACGTENLNIMLQQRLNPKSPDKRELPFRGVVFREGDRVMQTKNNYDLVWEKTDGSEGCGIFNGDIGVISTIEHSREFMRITFDDREVKYDFTLLEELEHAYAVTVHKSQGSEYPTVVIPIYSCPPMLRTRNLLYTALTRARNIAVLVGREDILRSMVDNVRQVLRYTMLIDLIEEEKTT